MISDETCDGILFGMALANNPAVKAAREKFEAKLRKLRDAIRDKPKNELIAELKAHNPAYIVKLLECKSIEEIRDRYVHTFVHLTRE